MVNVMIWSHSLMSTTNIVTISRSRSCCFTLMTESKCVVIHIHSNIILHLFCVRTWCFLHIYSENWNLLKATIYQDIHRSGNEKMSLWMVQVPIHLIIPIILSNLKVQFQERRAEMYLKNISSSSLKNILLCLSLYIFWGNIFHIFRASVFFYLGHASQTDSITVRALSPDLTFFLGCFMNNKRSYNQILSGRTLL